MAELPQAIPYHRLGEWQLDSVHTYVNSFTDVRVLGLFTAPSGRVYRQEGFYAGEGRWTVRFNPSERGQWRCQFQSWPADPNLEQTGTFEVTQSDEARGFLRVTPQNGWGFSYESGEPIFLLGDTVYHLFGMAYCELPVEKLMQRRARQGFNLLRVRVPISPFHPPNGYNQWQDRPIWAWGGSPQSPQFDRFNLDYFKTVDRIMFEAEKLGLGIELIMEAWGSEFPFNQRQVFLPEWEDLWLRYLVARYDAFNCLAMWTPLNEYEYYPDGTWGYKPVASRWLARVGRRIKELGAHDHPVALHNQYREPTFAERFLDDPDAVDVVLLQDWGTMDKERGWLTAHIEHNRQHSLKNWPGAALLAEWGYERNPALPLLIPIHEFCDLEHTRRGAWRGAMSGWGVIHGFDNTWGPFALLDEDQPGLAYLLHLRHFLTEIVPFATLRPADGLIKNPDSYPDGESPLVLADESRQTVVVYLPTGRPFTLEGLDAGEYQVSRFDPRSGKLTDDITLDVQPGETNATNDWLILLRKH